MKIKWDLLEEARKIINDLNNLPLLIKEDKIERKVLVEYQQVLVAELIWITRKMKEFQKEIEKEEKSSNR